MESRREQRLRNFLAVPLGHERAKLLFMWVKQGVINVGEFSNLTLWLDGDPEPDDEEEEITYEDYFEDDMPGGFF